MFHCPQYLLDSVKMLMVRNGDLNLLGDYIIVGLGGGFDILPHLLEDARDVSDYAMAIKMYTVLFQGVKVSAMAKVTDPLILSGL